MPISFLNPWLWLGALAAAAPIWLHLRRKRQTNLFAFSALRFLEDQPLARQGPLRLRHLALLALRLLALVLLVAAFSWPYLRGPNTAPIRESRVYVLDNTLSRQAHDGFDHDLKRLQQELARTDYGVQVAVVELTSIPRVVVGFGDERAAALNKLRALRPSFQRGSYLAAFRLANELLGSSLGVLRRVVFLSDSQENQWTDLPSTPPFLRHVEIDLPKPTAQRLPNLSLSDPRAQRIFLGDDSRVSFSVKLEHTGEAKMATVTLRANGQTVFHRDVVLEHQPRTILVQSEWKADPRTWLRGEAIVEGAPDALAADNRAYFSLPPVAEATVALLAQSPYLRLALSPDIMRGRWAARVLEPGRLDAEIRAHHDADVLCVESGFLESAAARALLTRYLDERRGVLLLVNRTSPIIRGCLRELGLDAEDTVEPGREDPDKFQFVVSNHPIFHPFLSPDYGNLMDIQVYKYTRLKPLNALPLVFSRQGAGLFFQGTQARGKLFVAAFGLDREHTSWPVHPTFIPFLDLTLQAARADDPAPTCFEPGETGVIPLPSGAAAREVVLRDGPREVARAAVEHGQARLRLPDQPGVYALTYDHRTKVEKLLCVNPSPKESQLAYVEHPGAVRGWSADPPPGSSSVSTPKARLPLSTILQQHWWWWMVLAAWSALMLEMALAQTRKERA